MLREAPEESKRRAPFSHLKIAPVVAEWRNNSPVLANDPVGLETCLSPSLECRFTMTVSNVTVAALRRAISRLPSDKPVVTPGKWYKTQKEHWLGWLSEYHGPGAYGRRADTRRDAK